MSDTNSHDTSPLDPEVQHGKQPAGKDPEVQHGKQPAPQQDGEQQDGEQQDEAESGVVVPEHAGGDSVPERPTADPDADDSAV